MTEPRDSYLLPCSCGRNLVVQERQAGDTVGCECGRSCAVPSLVEIRRLRPVEKPVSAVPQQWGSAQRFLTGGAALILVAGTAAAIIFWQYPSDAAIERFAQQRRQQLLAMKPWDAVQHYRHFIAPGIETPIDSRFQDYRSMLGIGLVLALVALAVGVFLAAIGLAGLMKKGSE